MIEGSIGCTSDGSLVVNSILEADSSKPVPMSTPERLSVVAPDGTVRSFDLSRIDDLQGVTDARSHDVGDRDVVLLVYASRRNDSFNDPSRPVRSWFAARFDRDGVYHGATELSLTSFSPERLGVFSSGDLLLFGADQANRQIQLLRYAPIGGKVFPFQPDLPFATKNESLPSQFPSGSNPSPDEEKLAQMVTATQFSQLVHFRDSILLLQMDSGAPLFQVFSSGTINTITLPKREGFLPDSLIPSDDLLYFRYRRKGTNTGKGSDGLILEVDPNTGVATREIHTGESTMWDVVCARKRQFRVVKLKESYTFQFFTAAMQPAHQ